MTMRRIAVISGVALAGIFIAGCATATIEDAVPEGALVQTPPSSGSAAISSSASPGNYPNLGVQPEAAAPQISPEEKAAQTSALRAAREQVVRDGQGQGLSSNGEALRRLATSHGEEALRQIEGE